MRKRLGQHFLINKSAINEIIAALEIKNGDTIVEIGPGEGALTIPLAKECEKIGCKIVAIEKDPMLAFRIKRLGYSGCLEVETGDALKFLLKLTERYTLNPIPYTLTPKRFKVVGNIPYYITGKLLRILSELDKKPELIVLTIQKEVAERIVAQPPQMNPTHKQVMCGMNLLAAATQIWAEPKIIGYLKPKDFSPPPEVESAIILLATRMQPLAIGKTLENYYRLIKIIFKQPRKTILNNLEAGWKLKKDEILKILRSVGLQGNERPQDLSIETIYRLATRFAARRVTID